VTTLRAATPAHLPDSSPAAPALVSITINGRAFQVAEGTSVAAAMLMAGEACRLSVRGERRSPLCGMGICMECRAAVDGISHRRTCQVFCAAGMQVVTE
jgi:D-hydroxyproline dehydrogenase subunit gamma